ncbi:MAG: DUF1667 domain-containing protein, partial [Gammaproteobacteria bacterium]
VEPALLDSHKNNYLASLVVNEDEAGTAVEVRGFLCKRGKEYAIQEHADPRRDVTTTVAIDGGIWPRLPVRSAGTVPKELVGDVCAVLRGVKVRAPVRMGDVVMADVLGTGVDIVATRDMASRS